MNTPEVTAEKAMLPIPVIAPALTWLAVVGNLQLSLRHPMNVGASTPMVRDFAKQLLQKLCDESVLSPSDAAIAFRDFSQ